MIEPSLGPVNLQRTWSNLMDIDAMDRADAGWSDEDFAAILRHQLATALPQQAKGPRVTFADVLTHPTPDVQVLESIRQFAKAAMLQAGTALPKEVASVLYYTSIVAGLVRAGSRLTRLDDAALAQGIRSVLAWPWLQDPMRSQLQVGLRAIEGGSEQP